MAQTAYVWTADSQVNAPTTAHITPVVLVNWAGSTTPESLAATAFATAATMPTGKLALFHRHLGDGTRTGTPHLYGGNRVAWVSQGAVVDQAKIDLVRFRLAWKALGSLRPNAEITDVEVYGMQCAGVSAAATRANLAPLLDDPHVRALLPVEIQPWRSADFQGQYWTDPRMVALSNMDFSLYKEQVDGIRDILTSSWRAVFAEPYPSELHDYDDVFRTRPVRMSYFQSVPAMALSTYGWQSPELYLGINGLANTPKFPNTLTKALRWNRFLDVLDQARALSLEAPTRFWTAGPKNQGTGTPTTSMAGHRHLHNHLAAMGWDKCVLWVPEWASLSGSELTNQINHVEETLAQAEVLKPPANGFPKILEFTGSAVTGFDLDSVNTNGLVTAYSAGEWA